MIHTNIEHLNREQAGTELGQAQSKLIQIGRVVGKKIEVEKNLLSRNYFSVKYIFLAENYFLGRKKFLIKKIFDQKIFSEKKFWSNKISGFRLKKKLGQRNSVKTIFVKKCF